MTVRKLKFVFRFGTIGILILLAAFFMSSCNRVKSPVKSLTDISTESAAEPEEATELQVRQFCGYCHEYPPPDTFPRSAWRFEALRGFQFFDRLHQDKPTLHIPTDVPSRDSVVKYYQRRAPEHLPMLLSVKSDQLPPVQFERKDLSYPTPGFRTPAVSNVNLVHLSDDKKLDLLVCDMRSGNILTLKPYEEHPSWRILGRVSSPAHVEVVDLDGDGIKDLLVADLGNFTPTNDKVGQVVWFRGQPDGSYTPITLLKGVGRVADIQAADFRGSGRLDLIVAVFGWTTTGEIIYLENQTTDWSKPAFVPRVLDDRHGSIHVPVCDLNKDGRPDFIALISQEHETIVAFLNQGDGSFRQETIYRGPHPGYGSSGIQVVDLNGDGNLDVLYTNGDTLDSTLLKPYHSVQWLENHGTFPFEHHPLASMYGAMRAVAADFTGQGNQDIVACTFLPEAVFPERTKSNFDSLIYLQQTSPGHFVRHTLESGSCDHVTCVAGSWNGDGRIHLATGNLLLEDQNPRANAIALWKNLGTQSASPGDKSREHRGVSSAAGQPINLD
jgi:hypothetical protein